MNRLSIVIGLMCALCPALATAEEFQQELLIFGSAEVARTSGVDTADTEIEDETLSADALYSLQRGPWKILGEYLLTNHEADLERFQIGWEPSERTVVWVGRFHQASSVWNHEHHHGQFLQTSITRPAIEEWEDESGIIPQHFFGLLVESNWHLPGRWGLHTAFGGGAAPVLTADGLEPIDVFHLNFDRHQAGVQARVTILPDELEDSGLGLLFAHNELNYVGPALPGLPTLDHVDQTVIGAYGTFVGGPWKLQGAAYDVRVRLEGIATDHPRNFIAGYVQLERALSHDTTLFGRREDSSSARDTTYLSFFPHFVLKSWSLGARWDVARRQALTLQVSDSRSRLDSYREFRLQWSAALP